MQEAALPPYLEEASVALLISAARRGIKQAVWARLAPHGITPQQFWVIRVLEVEPDLSLHALAQRIWTDDPTACRLVKTMQVRGYLTVSPDPGHGRRSRIRLSEQGLALGQKLTLLSSDVKSAVESELGLDEHELLRESLKKIIVKVGELQAEAPAVRGR